MKRRPPISLLVVFTLTLIVVVPRATGASVSDWVAVGDQRGDSFGYSVASAGDVNGDGFADVIVGAPANYGVQDGRAFVYLGSAQGPSRTPNWVAKGNQQFGRFGYSVAGAGDVNGDGFADVIAGAGDVNGDGFADVIVGAPGVNNGRGRAVMYLGSPSGLSASPDW